MGAHGDSSGVPISFAAESGMSDDLIANKIRHFDLNGDGYIERKELKAVLKGQDPEKWTEKELGRLFRYLDVNEDDRIDYDEFVEWVFNRERSAGGGFLGKLQSV